MELARSLNGPNEEDSKWLKHLLRYSKGALHYMMARRPFTTLLTEFGQKTDLRVYVVAIGLDALPREVYFRGTSSSVRLPALLQTQIMVALSPAETELYAIRANIGEALHARLSRLGARLLGRLNILMATVSLSGKTSATTFGTVKKARRMQLRSLCMQDLSHGGA